MFHLAQVLSRKSDIELSIVFPGGKDSIRRYHAKSGIRYFGYNRTLLKNVKKLIASGVLYTIVAEIKPDIVNIFGTELPHAQVMATLCKKQGIPCVITVQGLVTKIRDHILDGMGLLVRTAMTPRNFLKLDSLLLIKRVYNRRSLTEISAIKNCSAVLGRTYWDKASVWSIDNSKPYYHCNEVLRDSFYSGDWEVGKCERHSIFISQANYPIKGFHIFLDALAIIKKHFPQVSVKVSGKSALSLKGIRKIISMSAYDVFLLRKIRKLELENCITFIGEQDEVSMKRNYLKSHVFVSASLIENESNSLSEAMILGTPSVASYVGGVIDRIDHRINGMLYQHNTPYILAKMVCEIFNDDTLAQRLSEGAKRISRERFNPVENTNRLEQIYRTIINKH